MNEGSRLGSFHPVFFIIMKLSSATLSPSGPTADVEVGEHVRGRTRIGPRWVSVADLHSMEAS
ncbi:hypothetical protein C2U69_30555 [Cupriavidus pinatubonensis]|nr:hypothetical protein C2U69_30555 [Cupriavidus pinatubonensis]